VPPRTLRAETLRNSHGSGPRPDPTCESGQNPVGKGIMVALLNIIGISLS